MASGLRCWVSLRIGDFNHGALQHLHHVSAVHYAWARWHDYLISLYAKLSIHGVRPRPFLLFSKLVAGAILSTFQVLIFLLITRLVGVEIELMGYVYAVPAIFLIAFFLSALGLMLANLITQLENFAGVMNFVIFPMFFLSSALYPLWKMQEASMMLFLICQFNPFTHCVELLRFALYGQVNEIALGVVFTSAVLACSIALITFRGRS